MKTCSKQSTNLKIQSLTKILESLYFWQILMGSCCSLSCLYLNLSDVPPYTLTVPILYVLIHLSVRHNVTCYPQLLCAELLCVKTLCLANFLAKPKFQRDKFKPWHAVLGLTAVRLWSRETMHKELRQGTAQGNICFPLCFSLLTFNIFFPVLRQPHFYCDKWQFC